MTHPNEHCLYVRTWDDPATGKRHITAHNVGPEADFAYELLRQADGRHLIYDGQTITLDVDNGRWVWEVVDCKQGVLHGRWPD